MLAQQLPFLMHPNMIFMHNNAPIHTLHQVCNWLHTTGYQIMAWLSYSPNLNPIKHSWFLLKQNTHCLALQVCTMTSKTLCQETLWEVLSRGWNAILQGNFNKLIVRAIVRITIVPKGHVASK